MGKYILNEGLPWQLLMVGAVTLSAAPVFFLMIAPLTTAEPIAATAFDGRPFLNNILLLIHVLLAIVPLFLGPWLFHPALRKDHLSLHRTLGKIYIFTCLISAATSFPLAFAHPAGAWPRAGFGLLALAWFGFTYLAYTYARQKNLVQHRRWMFRSYACTYAFVNVKMYGMILNGIAAEVHPLIVKILQSCFSWMSNLLVAEVYLAATTYLGVYVGHKLFFKNLRSLPLKAAAVVLIFALTIFISDRFFHVENPVYGHDARDFGARPPSGR